MTFSEKMTPVEDFYRSLSSISIQNNYMIFYNFCFNLNRLPAASRIVGCHNDAQSGLTTIFNFANVQLIKLSYLGKSAMIARIQSLLSAAVLAAVALTIPASNASASIYYSWSGNCTFNCSGSSTATLEVRDSYVGATNLVYDDFISFSYSSSRGSFRVPGNARLRSISGVLPIGGTSSPTNLSIDFSGWFTHQITSTTGRWRTAFIRTGVYERGNGSTWSGGGGTIDLPAPGSLLATMGALLALIFVRRFGRRNLAAQA